MQITRTHPVARATAHYTARHRHHVPGGGYTDWSEGVANGRHSHAMADADGLSHVADSVGSPVHRHAWSLHRRLRKEQGYTSGPLVERSPVPPLQWLQRVLGR